MRAAAITTATAAILAALSGCAPQVRQSSFETLGLPPADPSPGSGAIILGWEREEREGWVVRRVEIDGQPLGQWDEDTQQPVVLEGPPGEVRIRLRAGQLRDPMRPEDGFRRRIRARTRKVLVEEGQVQVCGFVLKGKRPRPRVRCKARPPIAKADVNDRAFFPDGRPNRDRPEQEAAAAQPIAPGSAVPAAGPAAPSPIERRAPSGTDSQVAERLAQLERRLGSMQDTIARLSSGLPDTRSSDGASSPGALSGFLEFSGVMGLQVAVDGVPVDAAPSQKIGLAPGRHVVQFTGDNGAHFEHTIDVAPGKTVVLAPVGMPEDLSRYGYLTLVTSPWSEVYAEGVKLGTTPIVRAKLAPGPRELKMLPLGRGPGEATTVTIEPGRIVRHHFKLTAPPGATPRRYEPTPPVSLVPPGAPHGYLTLQTAPWSIAVFGGKRLGQTPVERLKLPTGTHEIVLLPEGSPPAKVLKVLIQAGQTERRSIRLDTLPAAATSSSAAAFPVVP